MKLTNALFSCVIFLLLLGGLGYALLKLQKLEGGRKASNPQSVIAASNQGAGSVALSHKVASSWRYNEIPDPLYSAKIAIACVRSTNDVQLTFANHTVPAELCLRRARQFGLDAYVQLQGNGDILCGIEGCSVHARFDKGRIRSFPASGAADHSTNIVFINRTHAKSFLAALKKSSFTIVEISLYKNGEQELAFNTANLIWK